MVPLLRGAPNDALIDACIAAGVCGGGVTLFDPPAGLAGVGVVDHDLDGDERGSRRRTAGCGPLICSRESPSRPLGVADDGETARPPSGVSSVGVTSLKREENRSCYLYGDVVYGAGQ